MRGSVANLTKGRSGPGRGTWSTYVSALARRSCSNVMASVRTHGPTPKARSTILASPTMPSSLRRVVCGRGRNTTVGASTPGTARRIALIGVRVAGLPRWQAKCDDSDYVDSSAFDTNGSRRTIAVQVTLERLPVPQINKIPVGGGLRSASRPPRVAAKRSISPPPANNPR